MFDYLMCCMLVFPALCIYDKKLMENRSGCCNAFNCGKRKNEDDEDFEEEGKMSLIHRILYGYYNILHKLRWFLLLLSIVGFGLAAWGATTLELPTSAEVRLVGENAVQYEQNFIWRDNHLQTSGRGNTIDNNCIRPNHSNRRYNQSHSHPGRYRRPNFRQIHPANANNASFHFDPALPESPDSLKS